MNAVSFSENKNDNDNIQENIQVENVHNSAWELEKRTEEIPLVKTEIPLVVENQDISGIATLQKDQSTIEEKEIVSNPTQKIEQELELESVNVERISLDDLSSKVSNRLEILKSLYNKTNDERVLKALIDELLSNYQFDEVKNYMSDVDIFSSTVIDKQSYIYTYLNTLLVTDPNGMKNFINFIEQKSLGLRIWYCFGDNEANI